MTMPPSEARPTVVLLCHERDHLDREGLASWLACTMNLVGLVVIREAPGRLWRTARREIRHVGWLRFLDVLACRVYLWLFHRAADGAWKDRTLDRLRARYPANLATVPRMLTIDPNGEDVRKFLTALQPDLVLARCKFLLRPSIFQIPRVGTFALHPGICPEYRNAHGCFWALVNRDLDRVGATLLKIDAGVDTGPIYLQTGCSIDEVHESHIVIQYRVVLENLDAIGTVLQSLARGDTLRPIPTAGRLSATWRQPTLTHYLRWKRAARRMRHHVHRHVALP
jgi:hypothetical protein